MKPLECSSPTSSIIWDRLKQDGKQIQIKPYEIMTKYLNSSTLHPPDRIRISNVCTVESWADYNSMSIVMCSYSHITCVQYYSIELSMSAVFGYSEVGGQGIASTLPTSLQRS